MKEQPKEESQSKSVVAENRNGDFGEPKPISRRSFLKTISAAALAFPLLGDIAFGTGKSFTKEITEKEKNVLETIEYSRKYLTRISREQAGKYKKSGGANPYEEWVGWLPGQATFLVVADIDKSFPDDSIEKRARMKTSAFFIRAYAQDGHVYINVVHDMFRIMAQEEFKKSPLLPIVVAMLVHEGHHLSEIESVKHPESWHYKLEKLVLQQLEQDGYLRLPFAILTDLYGQLDVSIREMEAQEKIAVR